MPREARTKSGTNVYHSIIRGINKQKIFLDSQDTTKIMKELKEAKEKYKYELYAYCIMQNHLHLLIKDKDNINKIMHRIMLQYSMYFNKKYERTGHLFQNRYLSKPVETDSYLITLQRYIHQNPYKMESYEWSSYRDYLGRGGITDIDFILNIFNNDRKKALEEFKNFTKYKLHKYTVSDIKDYEMDTKLPDEQVIKLITNRLGISNIDELKKYNVTIRNNYIREILQTDEIKVMQLSRVTGIDKKIISEIKKTCPKR